jgi:RNA polymerase sigma-70 factor (sigma-E family)
VNRPTEEPPVRADEERHFREFAAGYWQHLVRTGYLLCGNWHTAEDLTAATFVKLFVRWRRAGQVEHLPSFARQVLVRTFLDQRRLARSGELPVADLPDRPLPAIDAEQDLDLRQALAAMPPGRRAVLVLRYWEDLDVTETARLLGLSIGTVKSQASRGLAQLRELLAVPADAPAPSKGKQ